MTRWTLCAPLNLTPNERRWLFPDDPESEKAVPPRGRVASPLKNSVPEGRHVELDFFGDAEFNDVLTNPLLEGKRAFFSGDLELPLQWFQTKFQQQTSGSRSVYNPDLHISSIAENQIHTLLGDEDFQCSFRSRLDQVEQQVHAVQGMADYLAADISSAARSDHIETNEIVVAAQSVASSLLTALAGIAGAFEKLNKNPLAVPIGLDRWSVMEPIVEAMDSYLESANDIYDHTQSDSDSDRRRESREAGLEYAVWTPYWVTHDLRHDLFDLIDSLELVGASDLHIFGDAGVGKTHLACDIYQYHLERHIPAIYIPASVLTSPANIGSQIREILDIPPIYSFGVFLDALSSCSEAHGAQIPIIIDALNESVIDGRLNPVWKQGLPNLVDEVSRRIWLVLITTCRTNYRDAIWRDQHPERYLHLEGFSETDAISAVQRYFDWYRITADLTLVSLQHFSLPIYLKLFCEAHTSADQSESHVFVGRESIFQVFERYLARCDERVRYRLDLSPTSRPVTQALYSLASHLWDTRQRACDMNLAGAITDGSSFDHIEYQRTKLKALLDESLLVHRDWIDERDLVVFTYDLFGGYLIAKAVLGESPLISSGCYLVPYLHYSGS